MNGERGVFIPFSRKQGAALRLWAQLDKTRTTFPMILEYKSLLGAKSHVEITYENDKSHNWIRQVTLVLPKY